ncbi:PD-(D/E)XK nuclease domain-containing protein [Chloroflexi bacterium TSY]|nr:PD-(D/E)XK nuclease domain-containing protein [Chloroflexi bacterium TSY]
MTPKSLQSRLKIAKNAKFGSTEYTDSEVNTNDGRLDCVVQTSTHIYILEFKLDKSADEALQQIKDKGYADKYAADPRPKVLLGINFSGEKKTVDEWKMCEVIG